MWDIPVFKPRLRWALMDTAASPSIAQLLEPQTKCSSLEAPEYWYFSCSLRRALKGPCFSLNDHLRIHFHTWGCQRHPEVHFDPDPSRKRLSGHEYPLALSCLTYKKGCSWCDSLLLSTRKHDQVARICCWDLCLVPQVWFSLRTLSSPK